MPLHGSHEPRVAHARRAFERFERDIRVKREVARLSRVPRARRRQRVVNATHHLARGAARVGAVRCRSNGRGAARRSDDGTGAQRRDDLIHFYSARQRAARDSGGRIAGPDCRGDGRVASFRLPREADRRRRRRACAGSAAGLEQRTAGIPISIRRTERVHVPNDRPPFIGRELRRPRGHHRARHPNGHEAVHVRWRDGVHGRLRPDGCGRWHEVPRGGPVAGAGGAVALRATPDENLLSPGEVYGAGGQVERAIDAQLGDKSVTYDGQLRRGRSSRGGLDQRVKQSASFVSIRDYEPLRRLLRLPKEAICLIQFDSGDNLATRVDALAVFLDGHSDDGSEAFGGGFLGRQLRWHDAACGSQGTAENFSQSHRQVKYSA